MQLTERKRYASCLLFMALLLGLMASCRSSRPTDAGPVKRAYHNFTARYNGYFNARALFNETIDGFEQEYVDSYDQLLPIVRIPSEGQAQNMAASMGVVVGKASEMIERHEISNLTDDAYLMIGKANFYRRDLINALGSLQYVYNEYEDNDVQQEALAWIGLTNLLDKRYQDAETAFDIALSNIDSSRAVAPFVYAAAAQFNVERNQIRQAIPLLRMAVETAPKEDAIRYAYVTGQLFEQAGRPDSAIVFYQRVIDARPDYNIIFNTRLRIARLYDVNEDAGSGIEEELWEMMEDEKNKDYIDQLYYVLGTIAEKKNQVPKAIDYYTLSAANSTVNQNQKGISYLGIADIWYRAGDYDKARVYYDSTMSFLSANYPGYEEALFRASRLQALSSNMRVIHREDSLQRLARLPAAERIKAVDRKARELIAAEAAQRQRALQALSSTASGNSGGLPGRGGAGGWYFYNPGTLEQGYSTFVRRWSNRPNEDNWRRSSKQSLAGFTSGDTREAAGAPDADDPARLRKQLLATIPTEAARLDSSNQRMAEAYYQVGVIYENDLLSPANAIRYYEELLSRFPENEYRPAIYYSLYKLYKGSEPGRSNAYKAQLLDQYPDSDYAMVINNPGSVLARRGEADAEQAAYYEATYLLFQTGQYAEVISRCQSAGAKSTPPSLAAKFALLRALAVGRSNDLADFTASLNQVVAAYPQEEPGRRAQSWLAYLQAHPNEFTNRNPVLLEGGSWLTDYDAIRQRMAAQARREAEALARARAEAERNSYFKMPAEGESFRVVAAINDPSLNLNSSRFGLGQLNRRLYSGKNYQHAVTAINGGMQLLSVASFAGADEAHQYYETLKQHQQNIIKAPEAKTELFYLTESNFQRLTDPERVREYRYYFRVHFLSGDSQASLPGQVPAAGSTSAQQPEEGAAENPADPSVEAPQDTVQDDGAGEEMEVPVEEITADSADAATDAARAGSVARERNGTGFAPFNEGSSYLLVVAVGDESMNLNSTRLGIGLFNRGYYGRMDYEHNSKTINNETQLIAVGRFVSRDEATSYYKELIKRKEQIVKAPEPITAVFLISRENFDLLQSQQIVDEYVNYFKTIDLKVDE